MNPLFPPANLIVIFLLLGGVLAWLAWKSAAVCPLAPRAGISLLRFLGVLSLSIPFFNPGQWRQPPAEISTFFAVLLDRSASMDTKEGATASRWQQTVEAAGEVARGKSRNEVPLRFFPFSSSLEPEVTRDALASVSANGASTDLVGSISVLIDRFGTSIPALGGVLVLSDGKQTEETAMEKALARSRAARIPFFALPIGESIVVPDIRLYLPRKNIVAFREQEVLIPVEIEAENLPPSTVELILRKESQEGSEVERQKLQIDANGNARTQFRLTGLADGFHEFHVETPVLGDEKNTANNKGSVGIQVLDRAVRVLLVEGSPYWDTKFIAQLLQKEKDYRFEVVYRLAEERFFSIEGSDGQEAADAPEMVERSVFPETLEELAGFDLIIFGKNVDPFLDARAIANLREWIEKKGGALILARGNPLTSPRPALAELFPSDWDVPWDGEFRWRPTRAGQEAGLFGSELPGSEDPVWERLPELRQAEYGSSLRAFSQVLVEGTSRVGERQLRFPAVVSRRAGEGLVVAINSGDLWRWDFFPQVVEAEKIYRDFWFQLFHWTIAYSEFLPGKDFALKSSHSKVRAGTPVRLRVSRRAGRSPAATPVLRITGENTPERRLLPQQVPDHPDAWETLFVPETGDVFTIALEVEEAGPEAELFTTIESTAPPSETDDLDPDPAFLKILAESTGGKIVNWDDLKNFPPPPEEIAEDASAAPEWDPAWTNWPWFLPLLGFFALEWFIRRRNGLI